MTSAVMTGENQTRIALINRTLWPAKSVVAEALMSTAELLSETCDVEVIGQSRTDVVRALRSAGRGSRVKVSQIRLLARAQSKLPLRALDAVRFGLWVFICLVWRRPKVVYVATDPPVVVPFLVSLYASLFRARLVYHVQDIHPEAADLIVPLNKTILWVLKRLDNITLRRADLVLTLTSQMKHYLVKHRHVAPAKVELMDNAGASGEAAAVPSTTRKPVFGFCGNAGRFQRLPLLVDAIRLYLQNGGEGRFIFVGGGVYLADLEKLQSEFPASVEVKGLVEPATAAREMASWQWGLLPIDDRVTEFAFPSKTSSYLIAGCFVVAICGKKSAVGEWVTRHECGVVVEPDIQSVVTAFDMLQREGISLGCGYDKAREALTITSFSSRLAKALAGER